MTVNDLEVANPRRSAIDLNSASHLVLDRALLHGGITGISATDMGATISISNVLIFDTSGSGAKLDGATGQASFVTVANTGTAGSADPGIVCSSGLTLLSSITWTPGQTPISGACTLNTVIAGPTNVPETMSVDPMFVDEGNRDYHLVSESPAKDLVDSGPATDLDGTPRPQGARFDIGAYEATN